MLEEEYLIIEKAKTGDSASFGALYNHYIKPIYRFIAAKVASRQEAEDLTHEVFLSAWQKLPSFESKGFPFSSWLYKIARNRVIDHYRTRKSHSPIDQIAEGRLGMEEVQEDQMNMLLDLDRVKEAMQQLTADQQDVLLFRFMEDLSPKEIADIMGKREGAVRIIQHRAVQALKRLL